jgi:predicted negative regulator of RcsB-dependent stress response
MSAQHAASRKKTSLHATPDDAFAARAIEFTDWARANIRFVIGGVVLLALIVGGALYYRIYKADREQRAATEFAQVQRTAASGNMTLAARDLQAYIRRYEGTPHADEATVDLGQLYLTQEQPAKAVEALKDAPSRITSSPVGPQAALLLGAAQQAAGNRNGAIQTYLDVADKSKLKMFRVQALQNAAILREEAGDYAGAADLYRQLVDLQDAGTPDRQLFEMRQAEAEAHAAAKK